MDHGPIARPSTYQTSNTGAALSEICLLRGGFFRHQVLGRRYVYYVNKTYKRTGTLWEGRYKSSLIDSDRYLLTCMRYIELNPIRAEMVNHPGEYKWSSFHANAQGRDDTLIEPHPLYLELGGNPDIRQATYRELFRHHIDNETLHEIRDS